VPEADRATGPRRVRRQPWLKVVEQGAQRTEIEHRGAAPLLRGHSRQQWEHRGLGLAARRRSEEQYVVPVEDRCDGLILERAQCRPAQGVDDVMEEYLLQLLGAHR